MTKNEKEMEVVKNEELVKRTEVENTPFVLVEQDGNKFLTLGNYRITDVDLTDEELKELTKGVNWLFLTTVVGVIAEQVNKLKENN
jgi:thioredoxin-related protein